MAKKKPIGTRRSPRRRISIKAYTRKVCGKTQKVKAHKKLKPSKQRRLFG